MDEEFIPLKRYNFIIFVSTFYLGNTGRFVESIETIQNICNFMEKLQLLD